MRRLFGSDDDLEALFDGTAAVERFEDLALFLADVKAAATTSLPGSKAEAHVAAISAEAARLAEVAGPKVALQPVPVVELPLWRRFMDKNLPRLAKTAAAVVASSMSLMGLAYAGVDLPGQAAANAIEAVSGVELPNQDGEDNSASAVADAVRAIIESDVERGCEFGQAVAAAASQNSQGEGGSETDPCAASDPEGEAKGSRATGEEKSAEGRAKASEASGGASESGADNASTGQSKAAEKSGGASDAGAGNAGGGDTEAPEVEEEEDEDDAQGSRQTGEEASSEGRGNAPTEVPGP